MEPKREPDLRRRLLPWAIGFAVVVMSITILAILAAEPGPEPEGPLAAGTTDPPSSVAVRPVPTIGFATDDPAPDFDVDAFDGSVFRLSDHQADDGRPILLNLWASWCFPCREEMPALDVVAANHPEVLFIGVAVEDDPAEAEKFAAEIGVSYLLAIDESGEVSGKYPALGLPATFLISPEGRVIAKLFGGASEASFEEFLGFLDT
ncbi:MAG: TlpA family protein disulfide reductase [Acidimicrobiia bacterium]|nr:TlpA family protein disulfide reductase [Acidimicrobiia bacterium]